MRFFLAITCALALSACSMLGGGKKPSSNTQFAPIIPVVSTVSGAALNKQLIVDVTYISPALNNLRIAVRPTGHEMEVYKNVRWATTPSEMLATNLIENLEHSQGFRSVSRPGAGLITDYRLSVEIRNFESVYGPNGLPSAVITVVAKLVNAGEERAIQSREFTASIPSSSTAVPDVVDAFASALSRVDGEITAWTVGVAR